MMQRLRNQTMQRYVRVVAAHLLKDIRKHKHVIGANSDQNQQTKNIDKREESEAKYGEVSSIRQHEADDNAYQRSHD